MNRQAGRDRPMDRCRDAELQASSDDDSAQRLDLETTPVFEVSGHRRSPLWGQNADACVEDAGGLRAGRWLQQGLLLDRARGWRPLEILTAARAPAAVRRAGQCSSGTWP